MKTNIILTISSLMLFSGCASMVPDRVYHEMFKEAFSELDQDKSGFFTENELYEVLKNDEETIENAKNENINMRVYVKQEFLRVDTNRDGKVPYAEFFKAAKSQVRYD